MADCLPGKGEFACSPMISESTTVLD